MHVEIENIIKEDKYDIEIKKEVNFKEPKSYLKSVCAFSNGTYIGYIIFGIDNKKKEIIGINNVKKSYDEIINKIKTKIQPTITPTIEIINIKNKNIILVKIRPGKCTPYYYIDKENKITYIRKNNQDIEASKFELQKLILRAK